MTCQYAFANAQEFTQQWFWSFEAEQEVELEPLLVNSAGRIWAAMAASGQDQCTLADWALNSYLPELNMVAAAVMMNVACVRLSPEQRQLFMDYLNNQLELIRTGQIELCAGQTGVDYPAFGIAQYGTTTRQRAKIIGNRIQRDNF